MSKFTTLNAIDMTQLVYEHFTIADFKSPRRPFLYYIDEDNSHRVSFINYEYRYGNQVKYFDAAGDIEIIYQGDVAVGASGYIGNLSWDLITLESEFGGEIIKHEAWDISNLGGIDIKNFKNNSDSEISKIIFAGKDSIVGSVDADILLGFGGSDTISGGNGNDFLTGGVGADYLSGGSGLDTSSYEHALTAVKVNLANPSLNAGEAKGDTFNSIENLEGSAFNDTLDGNAGANTLSGLDGSDLLRGAAGNDVLQGGNGSDTLGGGDGNDLLAGGAGADYLSGGLGNDTASYEGASAGVTVNLADPPLNTGDAAGDTFNSIENVEGSGFGDKLTGNGAANVIKGLNGGDLINGGGGSDTFTGGAGKDVFVFSDALGVSNVDTVTDFSPADDTIRLENAVFAALANTGTLSSSYFRANTTGTAQDANDFIVYETDTGKLLYDADGNGTGLAIHFATLTGNPAITAADFQVI
jgi:serralysin